MAGSKEETPEAIEARRRREAEEFARERERLAEERAGRKVDKTIALSAEEAKNALQLKELQETQDKARKDVIAGAANMGPEEAAAYLEEKGKVQEKLFKEQRDRLARQQQERAERHAQLDRNRGERER